MSSPAKVPSTTSSGSGGGDVQRFYRQFESNVVDLRHLIAQLAALAPTTATAERQAATQKILSGLSSLSTEVADAAEYVPARDRETYSQVIKSLTDDLNATTAKFAPRSRFQFKSRTAPAAATSAQPQPPPSPASATHSSSRTRTNTTTSALAPSLALVTSRDYNAEIANPATGGVRRPSFSTARDMAISGHTGLHIAVPASAGGATSAGRVTAMRGCVVNCLAATPGCGGESVGGQGETSHAAPFASLALRDIDECLVVAGRVAGPVHVMRVRKSVLVVAARQARLHECVDVDVYLHCRSRPVIEDCRGLRIAPLPECLMMETEKALENQWDQVDDFKWLKAEPSPNWAILPQEERVVDNIWRETVIPSGGELSAAVILEKVGVQLGCGEQA